MTAAPREMRVSSRSPSLLGRLARALIKLIVLGVVIVLGALLGLVLFWGLFTTVLVPLQTTTQALAALEQTQAQVADEFARREARLAELEAALAESQTRLERTASENERLQARLADVAAELTATQEEVARLRARMVALDRQASRRREDVRRLQSDLEDIAERLDRLQTLVDAQSAELNAMSSDIADLQLAALAPDGRVARLEHTAQLLWVQANVLNALRELEHRNFGLAEEYVARTREDAVLLAAAATGPQQETLATVVGHLDEALRLLRDDPFAATGALDAAWRALNAAVR
ncbi:MAG: hypothetical protein Q9O62_06930 [Ardenticatenia bacterium]|nr:hypothetical protein [Ardenticatenia bacterium]